MGSPVGGTDALAEMPCRALRRLGARRVRLRGGWTATGAEHALSARRSSRHQRNALSGQPDSEPQLGARRPVHIGARVATGFRVTDPIKNRLSLNHYPSSVPCYFGPQCDYWTNELKQIASIGSGPCPDAAEATLSAIADLSKLHNVEHRARRPWPGRNAGLTLPGGHMTRSLSGCGGCGARARHPVVRAAEVGAPGVAATFLRRLHRLPSRRIPTPACRIS
jgi:hypothetical protein